MTSEKPKVAFYWCASCGGCEETVVDLNEAILEVVASVDIVFWPAALDFKTKHVLSMEDSSIAASFINGAIRTDEQLHMAQVLRQKSQLVIAFGACAQLGGIPGLANLTSREAILRSSYLQSPTVENPTGRLPQERSQFGKYELRLPKFWSQVHNLAQCIEVDYSLPGCPPTPLLLQEAVGAILSGKLPERGSVLAPEKALCDSCKRRKTKRADTKITQLFRPHEIQADDQLCFLEQGIICCGPATRSGCGEACISGNMPCTGCFGPPPDVADQGAKLLSAIASLFVAKTHEEAKAMVEKIVDPAGTFSRYGVPASMLSMKIEREP